MTEYQPPKEAVDRNYRLVAAVLDHEARVNPGRVYASQPLTSDLDDGLRDFTFAQVRDAVDAFAWWLEETIGKSDSFRTLAYVGVDDLRYALFFFACIKTGHKALFVSPRNTAEQNAHLTMITDCSHFYFSPEVASIANRVVDVADGRLNAQLVEPMNHWLATNSKPYPYSKTFEEARYDPVVVLHSSGSTGPPKAIVENNQFFINEQKKVGLHEGRQIVGIYPWEVEGGGYVFSTFPACHLGGVFSMCARLVYSKSASLLLAPPGRPPTADIALKLMALRPVRTLVSPPSILEALARLPEAQSYIKKLDWVMYAGGPLTKSCGDELSKSAQVSSTYGSTETGAVSTYRPELGDWQWQEFLAVEKVTFEEELDGTFEMVLYQDKEADEQRCIGGTMLRTDPCYRTKDLWVPHPSKANLWRFYGRKDDIMIFSNGQKWNPMPSEIYILSKTKAEGALITGVGRTEPALLLEMAVDDGQEAKALDEVWPAVQEANGQTQRYGRISKQRIAFIKPGTFLRTPKGTVVRRSSLSSCQEQIEQLYSENASDSNGIANGHENDDKPKQPLPDDLVSLIRGCVHQIGTVGDVSDNQDLFIRGLDSLEAAEIARSMKTALWPYATSSSLAFLGSHFVFANPTIAWLSEGTTAKLTGQMINDNREGSSFSEILTKYEKVLGSIGPGSSGSATRGLGKVAITGTTGSLGNQIARAFLSSERVSNVICMNRNAKAEARFKVQQHPQSNKATFLTVDYGRPFLGLSDSSQAALEEVDAIIHCAWQVDFNRSLGTFEPQIAVLADLAKIASTGSKTSRLFFVSSISAAPQDCQEVIDIGGVPETLVTEPKDGQSTPRMGYAASKNVSEHLLSFAANELKLPATVLRVGQIAGCTPAQQDAPAWNRKEWLPALIDTSNSLGLLPMNQPDVDWVPVDAVAQTICDIVAHDIQRSDFAVYNIVNPQPVPWASLASTVQSALRSRVELVPNSEWLAALKRQNDGSSAKLENFPSLKILHFYEGSTASAEAGRRVETGMACRASSTLASLPPIDQKQMKHWMAQWGYKP